MVWVLLFCLDILKKLESKITTREEEQGIRLKFPFRELIDHYYEHMGQYNEFSLSIEDIIWGR